MADDRDVYRSDYLIVSPGVAAMMEREAYEAGVHPGPYFVPLDQIAERLMGKWRRARRR